VEFKQCTKPAQVPHGSGPTREMDIIYMDTHISEAADKSSSYNLSKFSSGANFEGVEVVAAIHEDSSPNIGELWPDIDKLDDPPREDTSVVRAHDALIRRKRSVVSIGNTSKCSRLKDRRRRPEGGE
jgi:hypothetical protein